MKWFFANLIGFGECVFEADPTEIDPESWADHAPTFKIQRLTKLFIEPGKIGAMPYAANIHQIIPIEGVLSRAAILWYYPMTDNKVIGMVGDVWKKDRGSNIVIPNSAEVSKFRKLDSDGR